MSFADRQYEVFVILGDPGVEPIWIASRWRKIAALLEPAVLRARNSAAVRSTQLRKGVGSPNHRAISFGRIGWNDKGHAKWTHPDSTDAGDPSGAFFMGTEVWAPSWSTCDKEKLAPDLYFAVRNVRSTAESVVTFNPLLILAVATDQDQHSASGAGTIARAIADEVNALVRGHCVRPWGRRLGDKFYTNAINDLSISGLFKLGPVYQQSPSLDLFADRWNPF